MFFSLKTNKRVLFKWMTEKAAVPTCRAEYCFYIYFYEINFKINNTIKNRTKIVRLLTKTFITYLNIFNH